MRILISIFLVLLITSACSEPARKTSTKNTAFATKKNYFRDDHSTFRKWKNYYISLDPKRSDLKFSQSSVQQNEWITGTVYATFDKEFDPVYLPFLVYSPDKTRYIDFDSYQWSLIDGEPQFEADQEVDLVNLKNKTVQRIAFRGPSAVIEDVYWQNDSVVVLLEIFDSVPMIHKINLNNQSDTTYTGSLKLRTRSEYAALRLQKKLKKQMNP